ncbi:protein PROTON GRADIENT REGULATION 5, chloroplastic-like [Iris pallida]|uniref:Protein PROTON GRADIENT REGULATION 5, chloroplastic-like n=1 Tax=Iris pallida TaxID=29817 RepID=A0AAX6DGE1_IRIPA|nr:protein PROTON GRADIENT REGULATION 5, chloroplastic-like [Iris pallida]
MATSISAAGGLSSAFHGNWANEFAGEDRATLLPVHVTSVRVGKKPSIRPRPMMGNVNEGKGLFAPLVVVARNVVGKKRFNQLRGKAIALHSQVLLLTLHSWKKYCNIYM